MEFGIQTTFPITERDTCDSSDRLAEQRLERLLRLNAEIKRQKSLFKNDDQRRKARLMTRPIDLRNAFGYFGLMIGSLPPLAFVLKALLANGSGNTGLLLLIAAAGIVTGIVGFRIGRSFVPDALRYISTFSLGSRLPLWILLGFVWGAVSGAAGGLFIFLIGSIFAGILGGLVGAMTVPTMVVLHSLLREGDLIETKHFLPIAFGITLTFCGYLLGL